VSQETANRSFDDLARAVAEGSLSRRRALKLIAGTALAALIPSRALADDCVRVCHVPKTATGDCDPAKAVTRCVSRRERRRHLEKHPCDCRGRCANCLTTCLPNGGTCMANDQCCGGRCCNGTCSSPCPSGTVELSNCTCAKPCTSVDECTSVGCSFCQIDASGTFYCRDFIGGIGPCRSDADCPRGQFCSATPGQQGFCTVPCYPGCVPIHNACTANDQCCSGDCFSGKCANPCAPGHVVLSNGTCVIPCTTGGVCPGFCGGGCLTDTSGASYCRFDEPPRGTCETDSDCPSGLFCGESVPGGSRGCFVACCQACPVV
jgi:hypothetical protein